jgi:hypothetical protein
VVGTKNFNKKAVVEDYRLFWGKQLYGNERLVGIAGARSAKSALAHAATAAHRRRFGFPAIRMGSKRRVLLFHVVATAGWARHSVRFRAPANQLFKPRSAVVTSVFKNRHTVLRQAGWRPAYIKRSRKNGPGEYLWGDVVTVCPL